MFTGIIETIGTVRDFRPGDRSVVIGIEPDASEYPVAMGCSVCCDGICLTLDAVQRKVLYFTAVTETLSRTTIGSMRIGARVNLERALPVSGRLDGHFVLGHVDAAGIILSDQRQGDSIRRTIRVPTALLPFLAEKGSVAVDGISLTVATTESDTIDVSLVPFTLEKTTMGIKRPGDAVNIECDVIARYLARLISRGNSNGGGSLQTQNGLSPDRFKESSLFDKMERLGF